MIFLRDGLTPAVETSVFGWSSELGQLAAGLGLTAAGRGRGPSPLGQQVDPGVVAFLEHPQNVAL